MPVTPARAVFAKRDLVARYYLFTRIRIHAQFVLKNLCTPTGALEKQSCFPSRVAALAEIITTRL
jgi:hypothetical protein